MISFDVSKRDKKLIAKIAKRVKKICKPANERIIAMDLTATHANGCPLDLLGMLKAREVDLLHDVGNIHSSLDRNTGKLKDCFEPRYAEKIPF
ncbi:hypothetical protein SIID45300_02425 [Candidatus Magnetaquicoccaceae bacterium FCR-1]|uniref:DUF6874 domain-containing protein n=1 Tax=Candidatus Magnetaquiglobus chichijimensis TaxID=3141448 RepID=A0ABQ0CB05_9PROT